MADRNEAADMVHLAFQPAGVMAGHADVDQGPFDQIGPVVHLHGLVGKRKLVQPIFRIEPLHHDLNVGADSRGHVELP